MNIETIKHAANGEYTEFSKDIKHALTAKLAMSPAVSDYTQEYDKVKQMKSQFAEIAGSTETE